MYILSLSLSYVCVLNFFEIQTIWILECGGKNLCATYVCMCSSLRRMYVCSRFSLSLSLSLSLLYYDILFVEFRKIHLNFGVWREKSLRRMYVFSILSLTLFISSSKNLKIKYVVFMRIFTHISINFLHIYTSFIRYTYIHTSIINTSSPTTQQRRRILYKRYKTYQKESSSSNVRF